MSEVTHRASAASSSVNPTTSCSITIPASIAAGDWLYIALTSRDHTSGTAYPSVTDNDTGGNTWSRIAESADRKATLWRKQATSATASKVVSISGCVGSCAAGISGYAGANPTPNNTVVVETNASGNETHAAFTPGNRKAMICLIVFNYANDNAVSSQAATNPATLTQRFEHLSTGGSDCGVNFASALQTQDTPQSTGSLTWAQTNGTTYSMSMSVEPYVVQLAGLSRSGSLGYLLGVAQEVALKAQPSGSMANGLMVDKIPLRGTGRSGSRATGQMSIWTFVELRGAGRSGSMGRGLMVDKIPLAGRGGSGSIGRGLLVDKIPLRGTGRSGTVGSGLFGLRLAFSGSGRSGSLSHGTLGFQTSNIQLRGTSRSGSLGQLEGLARQIAAKPVPSGSFAHGDITIIHYLAPTFSGSLGHGFLTVSAQLVALTPAQARYLVPAPVILHGPITHTLTPASAHFTVPTPTIVRGGRTLGLDAARASFLVPTPSIGGGIFKTLTPVVARFVVPVPTFLRGGITHSLSAAAARFLAPGTTVLIGGLIVPLTPALARFLVPSPAIGGKVPLNPALARWVVPTPVMVRGTMTVALNPAILVAYVPAPSFTVGARTVGLGTARAQWYVTWALMSGGARPHAPSRRGKYQPEHDRAFVDTSGATEFGPEHSRARVDVEDAGI